ncbi:Titin [Larimichthys crocea]|uniref:Uncharacterized protein n=2 Tax=Larimichthys crocea TaxID=215358 RepID=A0ACD3QI39_LARCR|nr:Titin [Larimichthys crocea]
MKWYKKLRDQYEFPEPMEKIKQKRMKRIRLSRWEQFYEVPIRIKDQYKPKWRISLLTQDDLETVRPARHRTPSPEMEAYHRIRRRSLGDLSDEELLLPVNEYLSMKRTEEERLRLEDELELGYSASPPSLSPVRFELSALRPSSPRRVYSDDEEGEEVRRYDSYRVPSKYEAGPSFVDLRQRHDKATYKAPRQKQRVYEEREDQELLRPHKTAQRISSYKSELKRMEFEEKTRTTRKETTVTVATVSEEQSEHLTSLTSEYMPKPIKKLPVHEPERSPTPGKAAKADVTLPRVDFASRYEERKQALRSERRSVESKVEVVTQAPFSLDHAPRITIRMRSHRVPYGSNTKFTLNVQSKPESEVKWFHNGKEIQQSSKYYMSNISGVLTLQITNCVTEDAGTYRVVCRNAKGETSDYATLDVAGAEYAAFSSLRKDEEPPSSHLPEMTVTEVYHVSSSKTTVQETVTKTETQSTTVVEKPSEKPAEVEKPKEKPSVPAMILSKPQSLTVEEGAVARFECKMDGDPAPSVTWLHEGAVVCTSARHHVVSTHNNSHFEISAVEMSDEGSYTVLVENAGGKQEAHFSLTIRKSESKEKVVASPRVTSPEAKSPLAKSPEPVKSPRRVKSPEPVKSPQRVKSPVSPKSPTPKSPTPKSPTPKSLPPSEMEQVTSPIKSLRRVVSPTLEVTAPHFLVQPKSQNVNEGENVKFTCEIEGDASSEVEWLKDNMTISVTSNIRLSRSKNVFTLEIREATVADSGKYTIKAKNQFGQCSATSSLNVLTEESTKMIIVEQRASSEAAAGMLKGLSASSVSMEAASMQASSYSSSSRSAAAAEYSFESTSASSMSAMTAGSMTAGSMMAGSMMAGSMMAGSMVSMSSSSQMIEMSTHSHVEASSSSMRALTTGVKRGVPPKIEALPQNVNAEPGKTLTVAGVFSGDPTPSVQWVRSGRTLPNGDERYHVENTAELSTLVISAVKEGDAGAYTLRLSNELGFDTATVNVHIRSM